MPLNFHESMIRLTIRYALKIQTCRVCYFEPSFIWLVNLEVKVYEIKIVGLTVSKRRMSNIQRVNGKSARPHSNSRLKPQNNGSFKEELSWWTQRLGFTRCMQKAGSFFSDPYKVCRTLQSSCMQQWLSSTDRFPWGALIESFTFFAYPWSFATSRALR